MRATLRVQTLCRTKPTHMQALEDLREQALEDLREQVRANLREQVRANLREQVRANLREQPRGLPMLLTNKNMSPGYNSYMTLNMSLTPLF
jgi:hypothetical protein